MPSPSESIIPGGNAVNGSGVGPIRRFVVTRADIEAALGYIDRHACDGLTAARVVGETQRVSPATFGRHFRAATGLTLRAAIRQRQLDEARRLLLRTELTPGFIARQCGFTDLKSAARAFAATGEVPQALRLPAAARPARVHQARRDVNPA